MMIAEESTAFGRTCRGPPITAGWASASSGTWAGCTTLFYLQKAPVHRRHHHDKLTFGIVYAFNENFILSLSHDEVVHLKKSLRARCQAPSGNSSPTCACCMPHVWSSRQEAAVHGRGIRSAQRMEPRCRTGVGLLRKLPHRCLQRFVADLNRLYRQEPACHQVDFRGAGFEWLDAGGAETNVLAFLRKARDPRETMVFVLNFSDQSRKHYRIGVPFPVEYRELLNSDAREYGGSGETLAGKGIMAEEISSHGYAFSLVLNPAAQRGGVEAGAVGAGVRSASGKFAGRHAVGCDCAFRERRLPDFPLGPAETRPRRGN